jgi:RNA polymerase sigma-70 factor (ECF subfamily)
MSELLEAYQRAARGAAPDSRTADSPSLAATLATLCARGRAAYPDLPLDDLVFVEHLARCSAPVAAGTGSVHAEDLYLACAALAGAAAAVDRLRRDQWTTGASYLRVIELASTSVDEVEQRLWEVLLVGTAGKPPKLATYSGKGDLAAFLGIAAQRIALDGQRHRGAEQRALSGMAAEVNAVAADAELAFIKLQYRDGFQGAIRDALALLDNRERMLLRMHIIDGLSFERIAKVYGVTQPTVSRWVAKVRETVRTETRRLLRDRLLVSEAEFESLAGLIVSQLDVSVSRVLRHPR